MENWTQRIFLNINANITPCITSAMVILLLVSNPLLAEEKPLIEPDVQPQIVDESLIDDENFEVGLYGGVMHLEDFGSSFLYGARIAYHLSEALFFEANYAETEGDKSSFEILAQSNLLSDRSYQYYNFNVGYKVLPGEAFIAGKYAFNTNFYVIAGFGSTDFGGSSTQTANVGFGYQLLLNDWIALHVSVREHMYRSDLTGEEKLVMNNEMSSGVSFFF